MNIDLSNQNILLTGASGGIGRAITLSLDFAGANLALHYRRGLKDMDLLMNRLNKTPAVFQADFKDSGQCFTLFNNVVKDLGRIDTIINNAGIAIKSSIFLSQKEWVENWDRTMAVNLRATGILCREAIKHFIERGEGRIINIASRAAFRGDVPEYLAYAASKGGIVSLTRSIAKEFGKQGIKAFVIAPGFVRTGMAADFFEEYGEDIALEDIALNKLTEPRNVAPFITFLASGLADHATGCTIDINAGSYVH